MSDVKRDNVVHLLGRVCGRNHKRVHEALEGLGLYRGQTPILYVLWQEEGLPQSDLAKRLRKSPATITKTIQRMERAGFVERRSDPHDERASLVYLTSVGKTIKNSVDTIFLELSEIAIDGFTYDELTLLRSMLERVYDNMAKRA